MGRPPARARRGDGKVYKRGRLWSVRWTEEGARCYSGGYLTEEAANQVRAVIALNLQAGRPGLERIRPESKPEPLPTFGALVGEWLDDRKAQGRRSVDDDRRRWNRHLAPLLAHRRPDASIDIGFLDRMITDLRSPPVGSLDPRGRPKKVLSPGTTQRIVHLLSAFYGWLGKHQGVPNNPVRALKGDGDIRDLLRSTHDPKRVPFLKRKEDVAALFQALPRSINIVYALGALAGLRPGEAVALEWEAVDFDAGLILVRRQLREGRLGVPKSGKEREVPIVPSLSAVLKAWRKQNPKAELVAPSLRKSTTGKTKFLNWRTIKNAMKKALKKCGLKPMTFYQAGRHTFASQWVLSGNSIYRLKEIMGHSSVQVIERYAHLTNQLTDAELARADVRLAG
jgi:integrase